MKEDSRKARLLARVVQQAAATGIGRSPIYGSGTISLTNQVNPHRQSARLRHIALEPSDSVRLGSIVDYQMVNSGRTTRIFILPTCGGTRIRDRGQDVTAVTPTAPLGQALFGKTVGDAVTVIVPNIGRLGNPLNEFRVEVLSIT